MHFAKHAAATALIDGWKSVELCQAYILMAVYAVPARRWEEDRSWLYIGLAIRLATDLNLHQASGVAPTSEQHACVDALLQPRPEHGDAVREAVRAQGGLVSVSRWCMREKTNLTRKQTTQHHQEQPGLVQALVRES